MLDVSRPCHLLGTIIPRVCHKHPRHGQFIPPLGPVSPNIVASAPDLYSNLFIIQNLFLETHQNPTPNSQEPVYCCVSSLCCIPCYNVLFKFCILQTWDRKPKLLQHQTRTNTGPEYKIEEEDRTLTNRNRNKLKTHASNFEKVIFSIKGFVIKGQTRSDMQNVYTRTILFWGGFYKIALKNPCFPYLLHEQLPDAQDSVKTLFSILLYVKLYLLSSKQV